MKKAADHKKSADADATSGRSSSATKNKERKPKRPDDILRAGAADAQAVPLPSEKNLSGAGIPSGFIIRRIRLEGIHVTPAELHFRRGLNVVSGASNTGKSFTFHCIDFMLGSDEFGARITEAKPYETVVLEIEANSGEVFTLKRGFDSNIFRWYNVPYDDITQVTQYRIVPVKPGAPKRLTAKSSEVENTSSSVAQVGEEDSGDEETLPQETSRFKEDNVVVTPTASLQFLRLSGLDGKFVLASKKGRKVQNLSFRNVARFVLVDEARIITKRSAIAGSDMVLDTLYRSVFRLLVTGIGAPEGLVAGDPVERASRLQAQADILDKLIDEARQRLELLTGAILEIKDPSSTTLEIDRRIEALNARARDIDQAVSETSRSVDEVTGVIESLQAIVTNSKSRVIVIDELLSRFSLLKSSFTSDLSRLGFIEQGYSLVSQIAPSACPACGQSFSSVSRNEHENATAHNSGPTAPGIAIDALNRACAAEVQKIRIHLADLNATVDLLTEERTGLVGTIKNAEEERDAKELQLAQELKPRWVGASRELSDISRQQRALSQLGTVRDQRRELMEHREELERELLRVKALAKEKPFEEGYDLDKLVEKIRQILKSWHFDKADTVGFDFKQMDLIIHGQPRANQGKGVRAILFSSLIIGLMQFCREQNMSHPGFVMLDSPLTTYKAPDQAINGKNGKVDFDDESPYVDDKSEVATDIQTAFFRALAANPINRIHDQIIIFDNKEPPHDLEGEIVTHFGGPGAQGREGFIPSYHPRKSTSEIS